MGTQRNMGPFVPAPDDETRFLEAVELIAYEMTRVSEGISPLGKPAEMKAGGFSASVTESLIGVADAGVEIARAIGDLAEAVRELKRTS